MISVKNLSFGFPDKDLYDQVSFTIDVGQSAAFIGSSGCGKSTLVHMLLDPERFSFDGEITVPPARDVGYISQFYDGDSKEGQTVFQYIAQDFLALNEKIQELCTKMGETEDLEQVMEDYQTALDSFDALDGDNYESNIDRKLGLANLTYLRDLEMDKISGGEFKLIQVIKAMLSTPKFIIMDEPDAFLDFENLNALKNLLNSHRGTMVTITHSRYLLNHCFNKIVHLENREIQEFDGNFIDYNFEMLVTKVEQMEQSHKDTAEIARNENLIEMLRDAAEEKADPARGRALRARVKIQERLEAKRIKAPFLALTRPAISITSENVAEDETILTVEDFGVTFDEILLENVNFQLKSTDKVAIIGKNGAGKTTLLRAIRDQKDPAIALSDDVNMAYLSQDQGDIMGENDTIYDTFFDIGFKTYDEISDYLAGFGFPVEKMRAKIGTLSGGERNILGLAKVCRANANLLILDEPVSHLDTYAQVALEAALQDYAGGILMISHDFYSIVNCMDYVLLIEDKTVRKIRMRTFRKKIYADHFDKDYLLTEQAKKALELRIEQALQADNFTQAKELLVDLQLIVETL